MTAVSQNEYAGVWVFVEQREGVMAGVSLELLGAGRALADRLGAELSSIIVGKEISGLAKELIYWGADKVMVADDPIAGEYRTEVYARIIAGKAEEDRPEVLLVGATAIGRDLAPRIAARLNTGCTADCTELDIDLERRLLVATKPYFGRNLMADIICFPHKPQMATVRPGIMELPDRDRVRRIPGLRCSMPCHQGPRPCPWKGRRGWWLRVWAWAIARDLSWSESLRGF
jgi:electron transfer flavoprotein alpha subunit